MGNFFGLPTRAAINFKYALDTWLVLVTSRLLVLWIADIWEFYVAIILSGGNSVFMKSLKFSLKVQAALC